MSSKEPMLKANEVMRVLKQFGFSKIRQKGSHVFFKHSDGRTTVVPKHSREDIGRGLLRQILREVNISPKNFSKYLR